MPTDPATIQSALSERLPATLAFLDRLVRTNSFTRNPHGVRDNAQLVAARFAPLGFTPTLLPCSLPDTGPHLLLTAGPTTPDAPVIACVSHLDTVYTPDEESRHDFSWHVDGHRIYGPGVTDIKGGTALLWLLLDTLATLDPATFRRTRWLLLFNAAEEVLAPDFADLCRKTIPPTARACLVFECDGATAAPDFAVVSARKGIGKFTLRVRGRGAHSGGRYADGASAIHQLARLVDRAMNLTDLPHHTTVNVGVIRGGTVTNRVPDSAEAQLEVRSFDPAHYARVRDSLLAMAGPGDVRSPSDNFPCHIDVTLDDETPPWPENPATASLIDTWTRAATTAGLPLTSSRRGGLSDGNRLWPHVPTLDGLGPRGGNLHVSHRSADSLPEFVDTTSFVPKALINYLALQSLLRS